MAVTGSQPELLGILYYAYYYTYDRGFSAAGPRVWNYLPTDLREPGLVTAAVSDRR